MMLFYAEFLDYKKKKKTTALVSRKKEVKKRGNLQLNEKKMHFKYSYIEIE